MVGQVNSESQGPGSKGFSWVEGVHDCGLLTWLDSAVVRDGREVLDVEVEVHWITERSINSIQSKVLVSIVGEPNKEFHELTSRQFCKHCVRNQDWK